MDIPIPQKMRGRAGSAPSSPSGAKPRADR